MVAICKPGKGPSTGTKSPTILILDFPALKLVRKEKRKRGNNLDSLCWDHCVLSALRSKTHWSQRPQVSQQSCNSRCFGQSGCSWDSQPQSPNSSTLLLPPGDHNRPQAYGMPPCSAPVCLGGSVDCLQILKLTPSVTDFKSLS